MVVMDNILEVYTSAVSSLPLWAQSSINLFLLVFLVFIYAIFIWKFYHLVAKRNILELNLNKYNTSQHPILAKFIAIVFYLLEYIIILPFLIFFWYAIFTLLLILLTESLTVKALLLVSATIISAIRMTAYYNQNLSKELAKMLPFTLLAVSILQPTFFEIGRIFSHLSEIPLFLGNITNYLLFIIFLEIFLRLVYFLFSLLNLNQEKIKVAEEKKEAA